MTELEELMHSVVNKIGEVGQRRGIGYDHTQALQESIRHLFKKRERQTTDE